MDPLSEIVPDSSIRVFLLIENRLLREALFRLFRKRSDIHVVGHDGQAAATARQVLDTRCDVLVIDSCEVDWLAANIARESDGQAAFKTILLGREFGGGPFMTAGRSGVQGYLPHEAFSSS